MTRPLIDTTPLQLWASNETLQGNEPAREYPKPTAAPKPQTPCLQCGKPARPGKQFCNDTCKRKWQASMNRWANTIAKTEIEGQSELFGTP